MDRVTIKFPRVNAAVVKQMKSILEGRPTYAPGCTLNKKLPQELTTEEIRTEAERLSRLPQPELANTLNHLLLVATSLVGQSRLMAGAAADSLHGMDQLRTAVSQLPNVMILDAISSTKDEAIEAE